MDPPPHLQVGPHRYRVQMVPGGALGDAGQAGHCSQSRLTIALCDDQEPTQRADTLMHELVHALLTASDLSDEDEEKAARILGPGLLALFTDNPTLTPYLTWTAQQEAPR